MIPDNDNGQVHLPQNAFPAGAASSGPTIKPATIESAQDTSHKFARKKEIFKNVFYAEQVLL